MAGVVVIIAVEVVVVVVVVGVVVVLVVVCGLWFVGLGVLVCGSWFVVNGLGLYGPILGLCWPILAHLGAMLAYLEGNLGPSWGYVGPSWGYVGLSWTHLRARLAHLGAMLAHLVAYVGPCWPILGHKSRKMGTAKNTVKRGTFWWYAVVGGRGRGPPLLRRGENASGMDTASSVPRGPLAGFLKLPPRRLPGTTWYSEVSCLLLILWLICGLGLVPVENWAIVLRADSWL